MSVNLLQIRVFKGTLLSKTLINFYRNVNKFSLMLCSRLNFYDSQNEFFNEV